MSARLLARLGGFPGVRQRDATDCGAACLAAIARYYRLRLPVARIRQYASTDHRGTTLLGLVEAATRLGFAAKGVRGPFESLAKIPKPAIAHVVLDRGMHHFVVVHRVTRGRVVVMDPIDGRTHRLRHAEFRGRWTGVLVLLVPAERFRPGDAAAPTWVRFWRLVRPHRSVMLQALVGAALYTLLGLSMAVYVQKIVDHVLVDGNRNLLNLMSVIMLALLGIQAYLGSAKGLLLLRTGQRIDAQLILGYYEHLLRLPQRFFDTMRVGEIISRVSDAVKIRAFVNDVALELLVNLCVVVLSFGLMLVYSWQLALVVLAILSLLALVYALVNRANRATQRLLMEGTAELEAQLVESLGAASTLRRLGLEASAQRNTEIRLVRVLRAVLRSGQTALVSAQATQLLSRLGAVLVLWVGAGQVLDQALTAGGLMSVYALVGHLSGPVMVLITMNRTVQDALIAADRLFEILDLEGEDEGRGLELNPAMLGDIRFERVAFRYGSRAHLFRGLDLVIHRGELTAIVGPSGSGKSTLAALLHRLYPLESGRIRIGEYDLAHVRRDSLRRLVGVVPQQTVLFTGTILENIAAGEAEPDLARVLETARLLGILEFVEALPDGFATPVGENGVVLSGGQRQRVAIARALYRRPEILVLDEATSALDAAAERQVQQALRELRERGKTLIVVAHRLTSVRHADRIVVLEDGAVAEQGTHAALIQRDGLYSRLWREQFVPPEPLPVSP